ncbi:flagellin FliC [Halomonas alkalicola]|uniref:flagellin N-terminal helical domain-containing protein n=1 Tax=Halomonas alkalicola TaxID=1930622 RepID=UPI0035E978C5
MSVINTNITSMIGQSNLNKSQNALQTSMERLSSGLRINSAKDDAAGQAIANRMTAQITGLAQAQRNANDGISLAQTAEGSLNQVNDNLQRIRELSVQAQNATNSEDDLKSIQDEIGQRLSEIDRISGETNFNGVEVLNTNQGLQIQVGANDGEVISVNLQTINASTLGLSSFDITKPTVSSENLSDAIADAGTVDKTIDAQLQANSFTPAAGPADTLDAVFAKNDGTGDLVARAEDGQYYNLERNAVTEEWVWDSSSAAVDAADVDTSQEITDLPIKIAGNQGTLNSSGTAGTLADGTTTFEIQPGALFLRNDVAGEEYAALGNDGNYYAVDLTFTTT